MAIVLTDNSQLETKQIHSFYTDDELNLLYKLENGLVATKSHDQVMENLRKTLGLLESDEV